MTNIFVWSIKWYQFIVSHTPSFIWFSIVGKCSPGTGHSRDLPVFSFFCIFWWNIHNMGPIWPLHQYPRRQNQKYYGPLSSDRWTWIKGPSFMHVWWYFALKFLSRPLQTVLFFYQTIKIAQLTITVFVSLCKHLLNLRMKKLS